MFLRANQASRAKALYPPLRSNQRSGGNALSGGWGHYNAIVGPVFRVSLLQAPIHRNHRATLNLAMRARVDSCFPYSLIGRVEQELVT